MNDSPDPISSVRPVGAGRGLTPRDGLSLSAGISARRQELLARGGWGLALDALGARRGVLPWTARALTLGDDVVSMTFDTGFGILPVLHVRERSLFEEILQFLLRWPDEKQVPSTMGAMLIQGLVDGGNTPPEHALFGREPAEILPPKPTHTIILVTDGPYSGSPPPPGMDEASWASLSLALRLEHEACHFVATRFFKGIRFDLQDELIADFAALMSVTGSFSSGLFLTFMGITPDGEASGEGRFANYLQADAQGHDQKPLARSLAAAAAMLEGFTAGWTPSRWTANRLAMIRALTALPLGAPATPSAIGQAISNTQAR